MPRELTSSESETINQLRHQILAHKRLNDGINRYANAKSDLRAKGMSGAMMTPLDWPRKAIEVLATKLSPEAPTFAGVNPLGDELARAYADANVDWVERQAIKSALRHGCSFVFTTPGDRSAGEPEVVVSVADATHATAIVDWRTRTVKAAYEVLEDSLANVYLPQRTLVLDTSRNRIVREHASLPRVRCAIYTHEASLDRPFGASRITPTICGLTDAAARTLIRQEVAAEYYQSPRPLFFGLSQDDLIDEYGRAVLEKAGGAGWAFPDASQEDEIEASLRRAKVEWAPQATMQPFSDQFRLLAAAFAGASSIPLQYLGVVSDSNPTSGEAIMAQEKPLVELARACQRELNAGRRHLMWDIASTLYPGEDVSASMRDLALRWTDPRHRSVLEQSQFVATQVQAGNLPAGAVDTLRLLPIDEDDVAALAAANASRGATDPLAALATSLTREGESQNPASDMKARFDALGVAIRAGVDPQSAARTVGLGEVEFTGAVPASLRVPEADAKILEE